MTAFIKAAVASSLLCLFVALGCDDSSTNPQGSASVAGTWTGKVSDSTMTMVLKSDMTFTSVLPDSFGTYSMAGTYATGNDSITLTYTSSLQGTLGIPPPSFAPVSGSLSGTSMTIPIPYDFTGGMVTLKKR